MNSFKEFVIQYLLVETIVYKRGHKNSKGENAPWTIISHTTGKIISSSKTETEAKKHLRAIQYFKHH